MSKASLISVLFAGAAFLGLSAGPASALGLSLPPEFELFESANCIGFACTGNFTVVNNSNLYEARGFDQDWWIAGFLVGSPSAAFNTEATTKPAWSASNNQYCFGSFCGNGAPVFLYQDSNLTGLFDGVPILANDIAPGQTDNRFTFESIFDLGSPAEFVISGQNGNSEFIPLQATDVAVPEPVTLSLFGAGLAGAAALRRRKKKVA